LHLLPSLRSDKISRGRRGMGNAVRRQEFVNGLSLSLVPDFLKPARSDAGGIFHNRQFLFEDADPLPAPLDSFSVARRRSAAKNIHHAGICPREEARAVSPRAMAVIETQDLTKIYRTYKKAPGLWGAVKGLGRREYQE